MRKYVSLGAAMMFGVVIARDHKKPSLTNARAVPQDVQVAQQIKDAHLEKPVKFDRIPADYYDSWDNNNNVSSRDQASTPPRRRSSPRINRRRNEDIPNNVKQYWYCGGHLFFNYGQHFTCLDASDGYWKNCWSLNIGNGNYQCYDHTNGKWEWPNWNERDYTPDNSHLTSIITDGQLYTSPSVRIEYEDNT